MTIRGTSILEIGEPKSDFLRMGYRNYTDQVAEGAQESDPGYAS